ncbi:hypothetical protein BT63DRAFT_49150 [Microthyrium microscopicum]|uniref:Zn(2)-C6 fungal-type domain-containing protein n=1 Tax=Microthyrium microscopicum TaxID=703497 RepID=A0A6A6U561_9PEZI|nr:hypothetical protein BT63DRAFT_49150 [Microthyrium microscopicum]
MVHDAIDKKTRTSTSKVRSGCITCKSRRVKCDEEKPSCRRCIKAGRQCEGYSQPSSSRIVPRIVMTVYVPPAQKQLVSFLGSHQVEFYHHNVAPRLSGYFDSDFWHTLVLQLTQSEPAIQHAVAAIGVLHRHIDAESPSLASGSVLPTTIALEECTSAMRHLSLQIEKGATTMLVPLVACVLFTCLEFLRGNVDSAMVHIVSGFKLLRDSRYHGSSEGQTTNELQNDNFTIERYIVPVFKNLDTLCILFGTVLPAVDFAANNQAQSFIDIHDARKRLIGIMNETLRFIRQSEGTAYNDKVTVEELIERVRMGAELEEWFHRLQDLLRRLRDSDRDVNTPAICLLKIHHRCVSIWLSLCLSTASSDTDSHTSGFREIIELSRKIHEAEPKLVKTKSEAFSFEMKTLPPLYYVVTKCRVPSLRRKALELMRSSTHREGLWNTTIAVKIAERIIAIEEANLDKTAETSSSSHSFENREPLPLEEHRIHHIGKLPTDFLRGPGDPGVFSKPTRPTTERLYECKDSASPFFFGERTQEGVSTLLFSNSERISVNFHSKPWGPHGDWLVSTEEIVIS